MELQRFRIRNFKNIKDTTFDVGTLTGISAPNNAGKTNLLQAMDLFFRVACPSGQAPLWQDREVNERDCPAGNFPSGVANAEIRLEAVFKGAEVHISIKRDHRGHALMHYPKFVFGGKDLAKKLEETIEEKAYFEEKGVPSQVYMRRASLPLELLAQLSQLFRAGPSDRVDFIDVFRSLNSTANNIRIGGERHAVQDALGVVAFSLQPADFAKWHLFKHAMQEFTNVSGAGTWEILWDRSKNTSRLVFEKAEGTRVVAENLGTGLRSLATLVARVALFSGDIALVDEPEQNISPALWGKVGEFLTKAGVKQIIVATHAQDVLSLCDKQVTL